MGVPQSDTAEMTGNVAVSTREKQWKKKRVFFLTPQVMSNDLSRGLFPADQVCMNLVNTTTVVRFLRLRRIARYRVVLPDAEAIVGTLAARH